MSLLFSEIKFCFPNGEPVCRYESGHPDEHDIRELLTMDERYADVAKRRTSLTAVQVQRYRYLTGGRDWLAEAEHFALLDAYNELAQRHGEEPFAERDDVEHLDYFEFSCPPRQPQTEEEV